MFLHVTTVEYVGDYKLCLQFNNGAEGIVDLESELYGEVFEPLRDKTLFQEVCLTSRTLEWPNGADFAPEFLFENAQLTIAPIEKYEPMPVDNSDREAIYPQQREKSTILVDAVCRETVAGAIPPILYEMQSPISAYHFHKKRWLIK